MVRPRLHSDDELLARIGARLQSASWTLADAARAAEVHPATLIKRFGSRRGVLEALSRRWVADLPTEPGGPGGLTELRRWLDQNVPRLDEPAAALSGLSMLMEDLQDDVLAGILRTGWARQRQYLAALIADARSHGELSRAPDADLAAALLLTLSRGALLDAAAQRGDSSLADGQLPWQTLLEEWT